MLSSSVDSTISLHNPPYSKLTPASSDSSCFSLSENSDPSDVVIIRNRQCKSAKITLKTNSTKQACRNTSVPNVPSPLNREYDARLFDLLLIDPEDFASQITLMDWPVFKAISPEELTSCAWNTKSKLDKAPNVVEFIRRFNHTNFWVQKEILHASSARVRSDVLSKMIKVAKKLLDLNNLNGLKAVITALLSAPIYRLESCWNSISRRDRLTFNSLSELVSEEENRHKLRKHLSMTSLPCIPFLGLYLTDLVYIDTLHPHHGGLEPQPRKVQMNNICRMISEFQQSNYGFLIPLPYLQTYLLSIRYIEELQKFAEDDNYKLSLTLEPFVQPTQKRSQSNHECTRKSNDLIHRSDSIRINNSSVECSQSNRDRLHMHLKSKVQSSSVTTANAEDQSNPTLSALSRFLSWFPKRKVEAASKPTLSSFSNDNQSISCTLHNAHSLKTSDKHSSTLRGNEMKADKNCCSQLNNKAPSTVVNLVQPVSSPLKLYEGYSEKALVAHSNHQGFVLRKQIMKLYKKPRFCRWNKFWMTFVDQHLLLFKMKPFSVISNLSNLLASDMNSIAKGTSKAIEHLNGPYLKQDDSARKRRKLLRSLFSNEPYKCYPVTGRCMVVLIKRDDPDDPSSFNTFQRGNGSSTGTRSSVSPNTSNENDLIFETTDFQTEGANEVEHKLGMFQLNDLSRGNIFKFKTASVTESIEWCEVLHGVIHRSRKALEKNLMAFD